MTEKQKSKARDYVDKYRAANRKKVNLRERKRLKEWRKNNPEKAKQKDARARSSRWEHRRQSARALYQRTRFDKIKAAKKWQRRNKSRAKSRFKAWYNRNRAALLLKRRLRRAECKALTTIGLSILGHSLNGLRSAGD